MLQRTGRGASKVSRSVKLGFDPLEGRSLMAAALAPIASITAPAALGYQVPLNGTGGGTAQTYSVVSSNSDVKATVSNGDFLTLNITHTSSGANDPAFTGTMTFQVFNELTPTTVAKIENLVTSGFYNGKNFHRIASQFPDATGFIAQGGSVNGAGLDQPPAPGQPGGLPATGYPFQNELVQQLAFTNPGELALANAGFTRSDINSADFFTNASQFFITSEAPRFLDFGYTIFGQLVSGFDVLNELDHVAVGGAGGTTPLGAVTINSATTSKTNPNGVVHIDTTGATAGETSNVTVTAFDPASNTRTSQSFVVTVGPTNPSPGPTEKPFLDVFPSVNTPIQTAVGEPAVFQVQGISAGSPSDALTYTVAGSTLSTQVSPTQSQLAFAPIPSSQGTATVSPNGIVTVTPAAGFTGNITVLVGVRDQVLRAASSPLGLNDVGNYDVKQFTVNVSGSTPVDRAPIAQPVTAAASAGAATPIQLNGISTTTGTNTNLTYAIATQPAHGTVTLTNASTGLASYTPTGNFTGSDSFTYTVTDNGNTTNRTSAPGTVTINVSSGVTGAVRLIGGVLVVTPPPNPTRHQDQIAINQVGGNIQVEVNGIVDSTQPAASSLDDIVVYGSKTGTSTVVSPAVTVPVSLDAGHGGTNFINAAAAADTEIRAWFGHSAVQGGSAANQIVGRRNHLLKVVKSPGTDSVFLSGIDPYHRVPHFKVAGFHLKAQDKGAFYKFVGNRLVKTNQPISTLLRQNRG